MKGRQTFLRTMRNPDDLNPGNCGKTLLPTGKVPPEILKAFVFKKIGIKRSEVLVSPRIGEDVSVLDLAGELLVTSTDPITGAGERIGWLAVKVSVNDLGAAGAEPVAVLVTLILPEGSSVEDLAEIMDDVHAACAEEGIAVAGGHSEVTPGIPRPVVSVTALGRSRKGKVLSTAGAKAGDDILVTKWAGMEGTSILVSDFWERFRGVLSQDEIEEARKLLFQISVTKDGRIALENGASGCHDATEGGVLGAIYEVCESSGLGAEVDAALIPVLPVTAKVSKFTGIDPLRLTSSGCLVVSAQCGRALCEVYRKCGLHAQVVGKMTLGNRILKRDGRLSPLEPPKSDELWLARQRLLGMLNEP